MRPHVIRSFIIGNNKKRSFQKENCTIPFTHFSIIYLITVTQVSRSTKFTVKRCQMCTEQDELHFEQFLQNKNFININ